MRARWSAGRIVNGARRFQPRALVPVVVAARSRVARLGPATLADARAQMRFVVGDDQPDAVIERLAAAYVTRMVWRGESRWHPELITSQHVDGLEHLRALHERGDGFIVNFVHHGDWEAMTPTLARAGFPTHLIATSAMFEDDQPIWMQQQVRVLSMYGVTMVDVAVGSAGVRDLLAQGRAVTIASDVPGNTVTSYLGHDLGIASGAARAALECQVPVAVVTAHRDAARPGMAGSFRVSEPLLPEDFDSAEELLTAMLARHEDAVRDWPEATDMPLRILDRSLMLNPTTAPDGGLSTRQDQVSIRGRWSRWFA